MAKPTLLLTRPEPGAQRFAARLSDAIRARVDVMIAPLLEIVPTGATWDPSAVAGVIFTSVNGVNLAGPGDGQPAYCVGESTAHAAKCANWRVLETATTAEALIDRISQANPAVPLIHLAGRCRRGDISERLSAQGIATSVLTLYDQRACTLNEAARTALQAPTIAPLFSPRTALLLTQQELSLRNVHVIALSPAVADSLSGQDLHKCDTLPEPRGDLMLAAVEKLCAGTTMP